MLAILTGQFKNLTNDPQPKMAQQTSSDQPQVVKMNGLVPLIAQSPIWNETQEKTMFDLCIRYFDMTMEDRCPVCLCRNDSQYEEDLIEEDSFADSPKKSILGAAASQMKLSYGNDMKSEMIDEMIKIEDVGFENGNSEAYNPFNTMQEDYMRSNSFKKKLKKTRAQINFGEIERSEETAQVIEGFSEDEIVQFLNDEVNGLNDSLFKCESQETGMSKKFTLVVNKDQLKAESEDGLYSVDSLNPF